MIIINKKNIIFYAGIIAIFILMYSITAINISNTKNKIVETVALPVNNKVIVIDARTSEFRMRVQKVVMEQQKQKAI